MENLNDLKIPFEWEDRRPILLEKCLYIPPHWKGKPHLGPEIWQNVFTNPELPLSVEFCSGNGQWIAAAAANSPHLNWIAVEKDFYRAKKTWARIFRYALPNLFVVCGEALEFSRQYLAEKSLTEAWVNFPDPWPKRHHAKHRLIQKPFAEEMGRVLKKDAPLNLVTDDERYSSQMIQVFSSWKGSFTTEMPGYGTSYFHELWQKQQRQIRYHRFTDE